MAQSKIIAIADAVAAALNGTSFSQTPTNAERRYLVEYEPEDLEELKVSVAVASKSSALSSRTETRDDCLIFVGVQKKVDPDDIAECDAMMQLNDEIYEFLRHPNNRIMAGGQWVSSQNDPIAPREHLNELRVFTSVIQVTYRVFQ